MIPGLLAIKRLKVNRFCHPLPKFSQGTGILLNPVICPQVYLILFTNLVLLCSRFSKFTYHRIIPVPHKVRVQSIIFIVIDPLAVPQSVHPHDIFLCLQIFILFWRYKMISLPIRPHNCLFSLEAGDYSPVCPNPRL